MSSRKCKHRFIQEALADPVQDKRMECAEPKYHKGRHRNATRDLTWDPGMQIVLKDLL